MIKAVPYTLTSGSEKFCDYIAQSFIPDHLISVFDGWMKITNFYRNGDGYILEFYSDRYLIKRGEFICYQLSLPETIDDFVTDMYRLSIPLYWSKWIDENFEPKDYMNCDEIEGYYRDLLGRMNKSHELL